MRKNLIIGTLLLTLLFSSCTLSPMTKPTTSSPGQIITTTTSTTTSSTTTQTTLTTTPTAITTTAIPTTSTLPILSIHFIDVGQGDSILIDYGTNEILIDAGDRSPGVCTYLSSYVDGDLEVMVATHPHTDHIGGLIQVLQQFQANEVWYNGETSTSKTYNDFITAVNAESASIHVARCGDIVQCGSLSLSVLSPKDIKGTTNNNSIVLSMSYGEIDFLFMGDAEHESEEAMISMISDIEILKVGHHCSRTASSSSFISATTPETSIYMCKTENSYGHPHQESLTTLKSIGSQVYGTDVNGTIILTTDGMTYSIQSEKPGIPPIETLAQNTAAPITTTSTTTTTTALTTTSSASVVNVQITKIFYDGIIPSVESDEYVEITNLGTEPVNLQGWVLKDISEGYPSFTFPSYELRPGQSVRVYTNEIHPEYGGFSFSSGKAVWNNSTADTAALYNSQGAKISQSTY